MFNINNKKISIITVSKNSEQYIEKTLSSVIAQNYQNKEFIVIDGGSTDNTIKIIKQYEADIDKLVSEPDNGIAEAMNKGIDVATGDYVIFINSDDYFINENALQVVSDNLIDNIDIFIFKVLFSYPDGRENFSQIYPLGSLTNFKMGSCHQGQVISRKLLLKLYKFDESFKINFDYDFILRAYKYGATSKAVNQIISVMRQVGVSARRDWVGFKERYDEERLVHYKNCKGNKWRFIYHIYWASYIPYRYFRYGLIYLNKHFIKNKSMKGLQ